ncbi:hypothetical protein [Microbacterium gorillae]|uniref:hypothetical protein n=1 Tax=Microbacterium gorillae TaxID=1231063 RepID=UPI00058C77A0|nr:hypothetical protein [Microbacterium gorillae]
MTTTMDEAMVRDAAHAAAWAAELLEGAMRSLGGLADATAWQSPTALTFEGRAFDLARSAGAAARQAGDYARTLTGAIDLVAEGCA